MRWVMPIYAAILWLVLIAAFAAQDIHDCGCWPAMDEFLKKMVDSP
jgi:hypothetical protein